jgi:hypothetical protein
MRRLRTASRSVLGEESGVTRYGGVSFGIPLILGQECGSRLGNLSLAMKRSDPRPVLDTVRYVCHRTGVTLITFISHYGAYIR